MTHHVFVYGSLKRGFHNHLLLENAVFLGEYETLGQFTMYDYGSFPAVTVQPSNYSIFGELYEVDDITLEILDDLEGHPEWYDRGEVVLVGTKIKPFMYFMPRNLLSDRAVEMDNGVWTKALDRRIV